MSKSNPKEKLRRRGNDMYLKYFYNSDTIINEIVFKYDNDILISNDICQVVFNTCDTTTEQIYELILYYPNKLKEINNITDDVVKELYSLYGVTIDIMKQSKGVNVRGKIVNIARRRAKENNIPFNLTSEDIILVEHCIYLGVPLEYGNIKMTKHSASIDKIIPELGYVKGNIQIISSLANNMKSYSTHEELITFSKNVLKLNEGN